MVYLNTKLLAILFVAPLALAAPADAEMEPRDNVLWERDSPSCAVEHKDKGLRHEIQECVNELYARNEEQCGGSLRGSILCRRSATTVTGIANSGYSSSWCKHVAYAVERILNECNQGRELVGGTHLAYGNGDLTIKVSL